MYLQWAAPLTITLEYATTGLCGVYHKYFVTILGIITNLLTQKMIGPDLVGHTKGGLRSRHAAGWQDVCPTEVADPVFHSSTANCFYQYRAKWAMECVLLSSVSVMYFVPGI